jgi:hypothetical protein
MVKGESNGKVAWATGANKGLGFEMIRQLAQELRDCYSPGIVNLLRGFE